MPPYWDIITRNRVKVSRRRHSLLHVLPGHATAPCRGVRADPSPSSEVTGSEGERSRPHTDSPNEVCLSLRLNGKPYIVPSHESRLPCLKQIYTLLYKDAFCIPTRCSAERRVVNGNGTTKPEAISGTRRREVPLLCPLDGRERECALCRRNLSTEILQRHPLLACKQRTSERAHLNTFLQLNERLVSD